MQIDNPFQMNDWRIESFLKVVLAVQLAISGAIGLDAIGFQIPIIRQSISFIYLTFIPGILILRILKLHTLNIIETILYSVGLSLAFLMFIGLFMNTLYPYLGISKPISLFSLILTLTIATIVLCILAYERDKDFSNFTYLNTKSLLSPPALFLILLPFFAIFGTYLINFYHNNILLMILIPVIALIPILIAFNKFIPRNLYPLAVFAIAISLLFHTSLISMYIWGWDIHHEYYFSNLVMKNSIWDSTVPTNTNAMLSIVMLAPIYSLILGMSLTWVFKIIYPFLFALVPLGLYLVFQKQTSDKIAFLACFFFVSLFTFYTEMLQLARQQIAELFLVLLILTMINKKISRRKQTVLLVIFGASLAVSHYGLSYIYMFSLIAVWLVLILTENPAIRRLKGNFYVKLNKRINRIANNLSSNHRTITLPFVLIFVVFTLAWYMYISSSSAFYTGVHIGNHIATSIWTEFLNPKATQGLNILTTETSSPLHEVCKYWHLASQFFIVVGILALVLKLRETAKFEKEYGTFSLVNFIICFAGIAVPYFASSLNTSRLYQITLIFLAPFCVIGGITVFKVLSRAVKASWTKQHVKSSLQVLSVFLAIFLLFNSGWVYEIANDIPTSFSLDTTIDYPRFNDQEVSGAKWLYSVKNSSLIYADGLRWLLLGSFGWGQVTSFPVKIDKIHKDSYIYLGKFNVINESVLVAYKEKAVGMSFYISNSVIINDRDKIYANGGSQVYW